MEKKILVAYFSASGVTAKVAEKIAGTVGAELYEIKPELPYNNADLNWNDNSSRCVKEWKNPESRPAICQPLPDIQNYDVVFIGYPIWWEASPNIIYTFLESCDFSGKTVVPFSTSGGSVKGSKGTHLHKYCSEDTNWSVGKLLNRMEDITKWCKVII